MQIHELPNLSFQQAELLNAAGIDSVDELRVLGPVVAYWRVGRAFGENISLLYSLYGALNNVPWYTIPSDVRTDLLSELDELEDVYIY